MLTAAWLSCAQRHSWS